MTKSNEKKGKLTTENIILTGLMILSLTGQLISGKFLSKENYKYPFTRSWYGFFFQNLFFFPMISEMVEKKLP